MTVAEASQHFATLGLKGARAQIATEILKEVNARLGFLLDVGLEYLTLDRAAATLSGGEAQRIRLASQLGSRAVGRDVRARRAVHRPAPARQPAPHRDAAPAARPRQQRASSSSTTRRRSRPPTTWSTSARARGASAAGSSPQGTPDDAARRTRVADRAVPGRHRARSRSRATRRKPHGLHHRQGRARAQPQERRRRASRSACWCAVTGVSGAGKSSLINGILQPALRAQAARQLRPGRHARAASPASTQIDKVIDIDQKPIGRTPRSNPATYTKAFDAIRDVFAQTPEARAYGYQPGRFSFNVHGGRCEACEGDGVRQVEMHFLPDVYVTCEVCRGKRYNEATLRVKWKDRSIAEVLETTRRRRAASCSSTTARCAASCRRSTTSASATSRSASRRRRCRAARRSGSSCRASSPSATPAARSTCSTSRPPACTSRTCASCSRVLDRLVDAGNTVLVIEHNLDVIKTAD